MSFLLGTRSAFGWSPTSILFTEPNPPSNADPKKWDGSRMEASLQRIAVWACVNLTATIAECMPLHVFRGDEKKPLRTPDFLQDLGGDGYGTPDWMYQFVLSAMLRGNVVGEVIQFDTSLAKPRTISLAHPDAVRVSKYEGKPKWSIAGIDVPTYKIWHKRFHPVPGSLWGMSPIANAATTVAAGVMAEEFGLRWFTDGAHPSSVLINDLVKEIDPEDATKLKTRFMAAQRGNREPAVLGKGWRYQQVQIAPNESQFLETMGWTAAECCRIFGPAYAETLGYETGGSLTYANLEQRSLDLLTYAVDPWLVRIENALTGLLPEARHVKFNRGALLRVDLLTRFKAHQIAIASTFETVNEVRELEDREPVPWGDKPPPTPIKAPPTEEK